MLEFSDAIVILIIWSTWLGTGFQDNGSEVCVIKGINLLSLEI